MKKQNKLNSVAAAYMKSKKAQKDPEGGEGSPPEEAGENAAEEEAEAEPMKPKMKAKKPFGKK